MHKIAIIGGGASATLFLAHLIQSAQASYFSIDVYDRAGAFAKGIAYATKEICHLLNVPAFNMSAYHHKSDDFALWAERHGYQETDFVPRKLYGAYLQSVWEQAEKNLHINRIEKDVTATRKTPNGFSVCCGDDIYHYDDVIIATGNAKPLRIDRIDNQTSRYYPSPWQIDEAVRPYHHIALIGSGLSAVDAILSLKENGFKGDITLVSRHGYIPQPHGEIIKGKAPWAFDEKELVNQSPVKLFSFIRKQIKEAEKQEILWRSVIDGLRPYTNDLWQGWNAQEQKHFMRHLYTIWGVHRHRMAKEISRQIDALKKAQKLKTQKNRVLALKANEEGCQLTLDNGSSLLCDAVINCMGYRYDEKRVFESSYKIGPAHFGTLFETTAIPEIRKQAHEVASHILEQDIKKAGEKSPASRVH